MGRRCLVLSASMGAGHDAVARELARRLRAAGHEVLVQDVLTLLPPSIGRATRGFYRFVVRRLPAVYEAIYALFLAPRPRPRRGLDVSPMAAMAERRLGALVERWRPDVIVSTFHLAAQITGRMRARGALRVPCAVFVTDFAVHRAWLDPGNDLYLCVTQTAARTAREGTGRTAVATGPVVPPEFGRPDRAGPDHAARGQAGPDDAGWGQAGPDQGRAGDAEADHARAGDAGRAAGSAWRGAVAGAGAGAGGRPVVVLSGGAWGVGAGLLRTAGALARHGFLPVLLCGRDVGLRRRAARLPGVLALGWVDDLPELMASARVLIDNAAGQTAVQALAAALPVVGYRPIPGHGAVGVREMAAEGLTRYAEDLGELLSAAGALARPGHARERQVAAGSALFRHDAARLVAELAERGG
ncbi:galactosyldiacylglycerol synthase [Streptomyces ficellus]|uniref:Galactosyldiacylglycerol synthase n=1 Tax=Streptomyces ficellus TaxID=1977088 RepID=A0ABT7ZDP5_9ACTN|nr:galactosyldiacylglycerol synthase [Streptomyces ficellus]MDN3297550.1 galactosyldiacylglycerol synthase [Streptomyces ficellus]